jgi:hypothetical protein
MSFTSSDILRQFNERRDKEYENEDQYYMEEELADQLVHEWDTVKMMMEDCEFSLQTMLAYPSFCENKLNRLLRTEFFDIKIINTIQCVLISLFNLKLTNISFQDWIHYWINNLYLAEANSEESKILGYFGSIANAVTIKTPRRASSPHRTAHEIFVAFVATNKLRGIIPNFAYVFFGFSCSKPLFPSPMGSKREPVAYCNSVDPTTNVSYVIYEKVQSYPGAPASVVLSDYIAKCTPEFFLNIYLQILYALHLAYIKYGFTHYNLNTDNIELRFLLSEVYIPYETDHVAAGQKEFIRTNCIATITDYSMSRVVYVNHSYGISGFKKYGIDPRKPYPLYDAYKLFMFCMVLAKSTNKDLFKLGEKLYSLFNTKETLESALQSQYDIHYSIFPIKEFPDPKNEHYSYIYRGTSNLTCLATAIRSLVNPGFIIDVTPSRGIISCESLGECRPKDEDVYSAIFCKNQKVISSIQFTYCLELLQQSGNLEEVELFVNKFKPDAERVNKEETEQLSQQISKLINEMSTLNVNSFKTLSPNKNSIDAYIQHLNTFAISVQQFQLCQFLYKTLRQMGEVYKLDTLNPEETFSSIRGYFRNWIQDFAKVYEVVSRVPLNANVGNIYKIRDYEMLLTINFS